MSRGAVSRPNGLGIHSYAILKGEPRRKRFFAGSGTG